MFISVANGFVVVVVVVVVVCFWVVFFIRRTILLKLRQVERKLLAILFLFFHP